MNWIDKIFPFRNLQNRRSWLDESRLTQSQFTIGFDSGGNESDNSGDEPQSTGSDTNLLKKETHITIQRKGNEHHERVSSPANNYQPLVREDLVRTSRNALPGYEYKSCFKSNMC